MLAAAELLGALSPLRLSAIAKRWNEELNKHIRADSNSPARQTLYDLCHGLRYVRLSADTPAQLEASTEFLRLAHPLTYVAPDKKSRVQQVGRRGVEWSGVEGELSQLCQAGGDGACGTAAAVLPPGLCWAC